MKKITLLFLLLSQISFSQEGTIDNTFNVGNGANGTVWTSIIQTDNKIVVGGYFDNFNSTIKGKIVRLNTNGSLDNTFNSSGSGVVGSTSHVRTLALQSDNKILLGGDFANYNGVIVKNITRINSDGTKDNSFTPPTNFSGGTGNFGSIKIIKVTNSGKILVGGDFTSPKNYFAVLNQDGTLDNTFTAGAGVGAIENIIVQNDGKILIFGRSSIKRMNSDGTNDNTFQTVNAISSIETTPYIIISSKLLNDNKILIGGRFTSVNGTNIERLARLNNDGTIDTSFNVGLGANDQVNTISIQNDNKVIIGGNFTTYNNFNSPRIARLNADGTFDNSFNVGSGASGLVASSLIQNDGKIVITGGFATYGTTSTNNVARINSTNVLNTSSFNNLNKPQVYPNPTKDFINVLMTTGEIIKTEIHNLSGQFITEKLDLSYFPSGIYLLKIYTNEGVYINKILKN